MKLHRLLEMHLSDLQYMLVAIVMDTYKYCNHVYPCIKEMQSYLFIHSCALKCKAHGLVNGIIMTANGSCEY